MNHHTFINLILILIVIFSSYQNISNSLTVNGKNPHIEAKNVVGNFTYNAESGLINLKSVFGITNVEAPDVELSIESILNKFVVTNGVHKLYVKTLGISGDNLNTAINEGLPR